MAAEGGVIALDDLSRGDVDLLGHAFTVSDLTVCGTRRLIVGRFSWDIGLLGPRSTGFHPIAYGIAFLNVIIHSALAGCFAAIASMWRAAPDLRQEGREGCVCRARENQLLTVDDIIAVEGPVLPTPRTKGVGVNLG